MELEETTVETTPDAGSDPALDEHRAALQKMRCDFALEQLYASSGAHDPAVLRRLIDIGEGDIKVGVDGIPDVSAVKEKIDVLRREQSYLFREVPAASASAPAPAPDTDHPSTGMRLGVMTQADLSRMDDASYYRAVMAKKGRNRKR